MIKKLKSTFIAITMIFSLTACNTDETNITENTTQSQPQPQTELAESLMTFDEFVDTLPVDFIAEDSLDINFLFLNPQNYGFEETLLTLPFSNDDDFAESLELTHEVLSNLRSYDRESLTTDQKLTYDVVEHFLLEVLDLSNFNLIDRGYLGSFLGYQAQLPLLLNEFKFNNINDLNSYFNILETADEIFQLYAELESRKLDEGVGMPQLILDKVIQQCDNFTQEEDNFLIDAINTKIDNLEFLSDNEKSDAKEKNTTLIQVNFKDAYSNLGDALRELDGRDDDNGLWSLPNGKDYYEQLLQFYTGTSMSVKEIEMEVLNTLQNHSNIISDLYFEHFEEFNDFLSSGMIVAEFDTVEENIDYLGLRLEEDFPSIGELNYKVSQVPKEMEDNFSPAAYVVSPLDSPMDTPESIYINGSYSSSLFTTIAHEGYPGHMYQNAFYKLQKAPAIRYIIDYPGYSEGWATYVENNSVKYSDLSDAVQTIWASNCIVTQLYYVLMDIDLHYNEYTRDDFNQKYSSIFGTSATSFNGMYDLMLETPGNYAKYFFTSMKFQQMHDETKEVLGDLFSTIDFHNVILVTGSAPFDILQEQLDIYIADVLVNSTQNLSENNETTDIDDSNFENVA